MNRQDMANLIWEQIKNGNIGAALYGGSILKGLAKYAGDKYMLDLEENLVRNARMFEKMARSVLDIYYIKDPEEAGLTIARKLPDWNDTTCLSIANAGWHMKFMEHECCQMRLQKAWNGHLHIETTWQWVQFCIALFIPFICAGMTFLFEMEDGETYIRSEGKLWLICVFPFKMIGFFMSPVTKFGYNCVSYIILLGLFTWFVLTDLRPATEPNSPSTIEYVVIFWVGTLIVEELRQMFVGSLRRMDRVKLWASDNWNRFDLVMYLWFILVIILRFSLSVDQFAVARICYCISLITFYIRSLQYFIINKQIGPKIIMIFKMMKDLFYFVIILAVFAISFGVAIEAILYPNMEPDIRIIFKSLYKPYWQLYGELFLEEIEGLIDNDTCHEDPRYLNQCPSVEGHRWVAPVLTAIYMLISSILLINLLIAIFSYTIDSVQDISATVWRFYRYEIISEYIDRPSLAPPLIIINHIWRIVGHICCKLIDDDDDLKNEKDNQFFCGTSLREFA
ncbi:transient receptor potential cation channel subfamily M member 3-like [Saccoglossus kowalevskii]